MCNLDRMEKAVWHLGKAAGLMPENEGARCWYGTALIGIGRLGEAVEQFGKVLEINPRNAEARDGMKAARDLLGMWKGDGIDADSGLRSRRRLKKGRNPRIKGGRYGRRQDGIAGCMSGRIFEPESACRYPHSGNGGQGAGGPQPMPHLRELRVYANMVTA